MVKKELLIMPHKKKTDINANQGGHRHLQAGKWRFVYFLLVPTLWLSACKANPSASTPTTSTTGIQETSEVLPSQTTTRSTDLPPIVPPTAELTATTIPATITPTPTQALVIETSPTACGLPTVVAPTLPAEIPGYTQLDKSAGLHITGKYVIIDLAHYRLEVTGMVDHPLTLKFEDLGCLPRVETSAPIICPGFFEDTANWAGASLASVLELAKVQPRAINIRLFSADGYSVSLDINKARNEMNFLAYEWNGEPLPILHGFPVRAVFPGMTGGYWLKWLVKIEVF
jgi:hypothetical protein